MALTQDTQMFRVISSRYVLFCWSCPNEWLNYTRNHHIDSLIDWFNDSCSYRKSSIVSVKHFYLIWILINSIHRPLHEIEQNLRRGLFLPSNHYLKGKYMVRLENKTHQVILELFLLMFFFCSMLNAVITTMNYLIILKLSRFVWKWKWAKFSKRNW